MACGVDIALEGLLAAPMECLLDTGALRTHPATRRHYRGLYLSRNEMTAEYLLRLGL